LEFKDKRILVIGLGKSGLAVIDALKKRSAKLIAYDDKTREELGEEIVNKIGPDIRLYAGKKPEINKENIDLVVVSPAVSMEFDLVQQAFKNDIKVISELELAYIIKSPVTEMFAITGTNGKTTTTSLLEYILQKAGLNAQAGGNIGIPLCNLVDEINKGIIVIEASSFQLERAETFRPHIAGILNVTPDHLDRHKTVAAYAASKAKIFSCQDENDFLFLNYDDAIVRKFADIAKSRVIFYSTDEVLSEGICVDAGQVVIKYNGQATVICPQEEIRLRGKHNLENVLCATGMAWAAGIKSEIIAESLREFKAVRHRIEEVASIEGILYINDSKGTNPVSTIKALESFNQPIILIAGGRNKGSDFADLAPVINEKVKYLVLLGEAKDTMQTAVIKVGFSNNNIYKVDSLEKAVEKAVSLSQTGDVVLLSPACASWDMFASYEQRGDLFCSIVKNMDNSNN
jgi:UDP-N-acetylmuramoylalanine--D-glutamate ligase